MIMTVTIVAELHKPKSMNEISNGHFPDLHSVHECEVLSKDLEPLQR